MVQLLTTEMTTAWERSLAEPPPEEQTSANAALHADKGGTVSMQLVSGHSRSLLVNCPAPQLVLGKGVCWQH